VSGEEHKRVGPSAWRRFAFAAIPVAGLFELGAHVVQTHSVAPDGDWKAARDFVAAHVQPTDLVAFAPGWVDPVGREQFGPGLATLEREARADETRFPRAFQVSIRGARLAALEGWRPAAEERFGRVTVTTLENPAPIHVLDDLVSRVDPEHLRVSRVEGGPEGHETDCPFARSSPVSGGLGSGPSMPAGRFVCPGGNGVGASVVADLDYRPHRCVYAPGVGGSSLVRLRFLDVAFGRVLHGHHALYVEAERNRTGAPVTITFKTGDSVVGAVTHHDGDGWREFEFDTSTLAGQRADLVAEIASPGGERRMYCFEADTR
jgi:hypothetical protein